MFLFLKLRFFSCLKHLFVRRRHKIVPQTITFVENLKKTKKNKHIILRKKRKKQVLDGLKKKVTMFSRQPW